MAPASHVRSAAVQIGAPTTLTKVEGILPEETVAVRSTIGTLSDATCTNNSPSVASIGAVVSEEHPGMTTFLKHLKLHKMPPSANMPSDLPIAPTMQPIVVNRVSIVDPQLAPIVGDNAEIIMA